MPAGKSPNPGEQPTVMLPEGGSGATDTSQVPVRDLNTTFPTDAAFSKTLPTVPAMGQTLPTRVHVEGQGNQGRADGTHQGETWGDFRFGALLGKGGMGAVYKGVQISLDRPVAIKVLPAHLSDNEGFRSRFQLEAKAVARINSPNVIQVYGAGVHAGHNYFAMEFVEGDDLSRRLKKGYKPSARETLGLVTQAVRGLVAAGEFGIVHRDLKPANMMVTDKGVLKIMDFGLVKLASEEHHLTMTGTVMGTVSYFSPEQGRGDRCDQRTDIYAMGVVFYELLTRQLPFTGSEASSVIYQHIHATPKPPILLDPTIPAGYQAVVLKCLEKKPEDRYQTAADLLRDLEALAAGHAPAAGRRAPAMGLLVGAGLAVVAIAVGVTVALTRPAAVAAPPAVPPPTPAPAPSVAHGVNTPGPTPPPVAHGVDTPGPAVPAHPLTPTPAPDANPAAATDLDQAKSLVAAKQFDAARRLIELNLPTHAGDPAWAAAAKDLDRAQGADLLKKAQAAFIAGDETAAGIGALAAAKLIPDDPQLQQLQAQLAKHEAERKQRGLDLANAEGFLDAGDFAKAEALLDPLAIAMPDDARVQAALRKAHAQHDAADRVVRSVHEQLERGDQAFGKRDYDGAQAAYAAAAELDASNADASAGLAKVDGARKQLDTLAAAVEQAITAKDLATAATRLDDLKAAGPGSAQATAETNRLSAARLEAEAAKRAAEERNAQLSQAASALLTRIDDPTQDTAAVGRDIATFIAGAGDRPEVAVLQRHLDDRRQRDATAAMLGDLDRAVAAGDAGAINAAVVDPDYAAGLAGLSHLPGLVFVSTLDTFVRDGATANARVRVRHALATFPERTLTYVYDLRQGDHGWQIAQAHLQP
jgi:predicted Ser/Thr protein kinase